MTKSGKSRYIKVNSNIVERLVIQKNLAWYAIKLIFTNTNITNDQAGDRKRMNW